MRKTSCGDMFYLGIIFSMVWLAQAQREGPCFNFPGHSFLEFRPNHLNISDRVHYSLRVRTSSPEGVLMYAEGPEDYEALYLSKGKLVYLLINPSPSGVEGDTGALHKSDYPVNNGTWLEVDVWRNWEVKNRYHHSMAKELRTGFQVKDANTGRTETHLDDLKHHGVRLNATVYFGGVTSTAHHTKGTASPDFAGKIEKIHEERNDLDFEHYAHNFDGRVTFCS